MGQAFCGQIQPTAVGGKKTLQWNYCNWLETVVRILVKKYAAFYKQSFYTAFYLTILLYIAFYLTILHSFLFDHFTKLFIWPFYIALYLTILQSFLFEHFTQLFIWPFCTAFYLTILHSFLFDHFAHSFLFDHFTSLVFNSAVGIFCNKREAVIFFKYKLLEIFCVKNQFSFPLRSRHVKTSLKLFSPYYLYASTYTALLLNICRVQYCTLPLLSISSPVQVSAGTGIEPSTFTRALAFSSYFSPANWMLFFLFKRILFFHFL